LGLFTSLGTDEQRALRGRVQAPALVFRPRDLIYFGCELWFKKSNKQTTPFQSQEYPIVWQKILSKTSIVVQE